MGELWFVGGGLGDEQDLSRRALDTLRRSATIVAEEYTSCFPEGTLDRLERELGRPIERLERADVEGAGPILERLDRDERVALLVPGDPFQATTHLALRRLVEERGHRWHYLPNASIATAAPGLIGLISYRFGRTVSIPFPEPGFAPTSPIELLVRNRAMDLHSLILLDLRPSERRFLTANEAIRLLRERMGEPPPIPRDTGIAVVARLGSPSARAWYGPLDRLETVDFGPPMHAMVLPAPTLHFEEQAALERLRVDAPSPSPDGPSR